MLPTSAAQTTWVHSMAGRAILRHVLEFDGRLLTVHWEPDLTIAEAEEGIRAITRVVEQHGCAGAISDTSRNWLDWSELIPLLHYEEYPKAVAAGLRFHANVVAQNPTDALAHYELHEEVNGLMTNSLFNDLTQARQWILAKLALAPVANPQPQGC